MSKPEEKSYRRHVIEQLLKDAREISTMDKAEGITNSGDAYARALGRCNGLAKSMVLYLEDLLKETK